MRTNAQPKLNLDLPPYPDAFPGALPEVRLPPRLSPRPPAQFNAQREADRVVLNRYTPAGVLLNEDLEIVQFRGETGPYLSHVSGEASLKILKMCRPDLRSALDSVLGEARAKKRALRKTGVRLAGNGKSREIAIKAVPVRAEGLGGNHWLVLFEEEKPRAPQRRGKAPAGQSRRKHEIEAAKSDLRSMIEQKEAVIEELQAAHEEVLSSNEELQSVNEELQTAKEEVQATNEELRTLNDELHSANQESIRNINDMNNFLESVSIAIVMVGKDLRVRRYTPKAEQILNLIPSDVGRPLSHIKPGINVPDFGKLIQGVVDSGIIVDQQAQDQDGHWYSMRVRPCKTTDKKIEGAVVILINIDELKHRENRITEALNYAEDILGTVRESYLVLDEDLKVRRANARFCRTFNLKPEDIENKYLYELGGGQWNIRRLRSLLEDMVSKTTSFKDLQIELGYKDAGETHEFFVRDNGIGIAPEYHGQIFDMFKHLHSDKEFEGTGAGLYIVRKIVENHGGTVRVESEAGKGTAFYLAIPKSLQSKAERK